MSSTLRTCLLASTMLVAGIAAPAAYAQQQSVPETETQAEPGSEIVVTGSRISRPDLELASPVNVISQQEIQFRQPGTADDLLRNLPAIRPSIGAGVNNGSDGSSTINLRGMGEQRTLVLLDGRRLVPYGLDGLTDTNNIPVALLQRVEVLTGGASSTYGADAVAGVVNFITRRDFSGIDASASYRVSERGDSQRFKADLVVGGNFADGRGNVVLAVGYTKADPLLHLDRKVSEVPISSTTGTFSGAATAQVTIFASPGNAALGLPASSFGAVVNPTTGLLQSATAADTFNTNIGTYFQTPLDRINAYSAGHYEITDGVEFYGSAMFTRNQVATQLASSGTFGNTYQLALNNPYLPVGVRNQLCTARSISAANCAAAAAVQGGPGTTGYVEIPVIAQRRFTEYGPRGNVFESQMFQVQGGFRGEIVSGLKYDFSAQYGETTQNQTRENWGSFSKVQQALRAYRDASGTIRCADTSNGCVPLNLFGPNGSISQAQLAFIDLDAIINRKVTQTVVTGSLSGDLFTSPLAASKIAFAVGGEYRKVTAASQPDGPSQVQGEVLGTGARTPPDTGRYSVKEVFGELIAPLIEDKPFIHKLTAEAGIRYSDYTTTGGSTTWKAGGQWEPAAGFKFRGTYQVAVRSPNIQELYQSPVQGLGNLTVDPCAGTGVLSNSRLAALCVATGAPSGTLGSIPQPTSGQINNTTAGNRNLDVEKAKTLTLGGVFAPTFLKGFSATVDYFRIKVSNAITQPAQADILNGCYSASLNPGFANNAFCALIGRNPLTGSLNGAGETPGVILTYSNLGLIRTAGIDLGVNQRVLLDDIGIRDSGAVTFSFNGTWLDYYRFQANPNSIDRNCTGRYSAGGCTNPRAKLRWNGRLTYDRPGFDASLLWTHISHVSLEDSVTGILPAYRRIPAYNYFDLSFGVRPTKNLSLNLTVNNLLDKDPPAVGSGVGGTAYNSGNTFPTIYDPIGRAYTLGARLTF